MTLFVTSVLPMGRWNMNKWYENRGIDDDVVVSTQMTILRNLHNYDYAPKITDSDSLKLIEEVSKAFYSENESYLKLYQFLRLDTLRRHQRAYWAEHQVIDESALEPERPQALIVSASQSSGLFINGDNHLQIRVVLRGRQIGKAFERIQFLDEKMSRHLTYAYSKKYGHLTTAPADLGTGMHVSYLMRLPMTQKAGLIGAVNERLLQSGFAIRLVKDISSKNAGNIYEIYNKKTLGVTEGGILDTADSFAEQLIRQERELRTAYLNEDSISCADSAYKAYGILKYAKKLTIEEAVEALGYLEQGILSRTVLLNEKMDVFPMMIEIQPESLAEAVGHQMDINEENCARAAYIQERLPELVRA